MTTSLPDIPEIDRKLDVICRLCGHSGLQRLYVFHSDSLPKTEAQGIAFDFALEYREGFDTGPWGHRWVEFLERMH